MSRTRIPLSAPQLSGHERELAASSLIDGGGDGEHVRGFEQDVAALLGSAGALAVSSSFAARQLALRSLGVGRGDRVALPTTAFIGAVAPIVELGAMPVFLDSEPITCGMDASCLSDYLRDSARTGDLPKAAVVVHRYGQHTDIDAIVAACSEYEIPVIEDSSESLGATYRGRQTGTSAALAILNFGDDKIITAGGGGMVVGKDGGAIDVMRRNASPPFAGVEDLITEISYDCIMNEVLAGVGRAQLAVLGERVAARRRVAAWYADAFADVTGLNLQAEAPWGTHSRWLSVFFLDPRLVRTSPGELLRALEEDDIQGALLQRPLHLEPTFSANESIGGSVAHALYATGICLPSSSSISDNDLQRVAASVRRVLRSAE